MKTPAAWFVIALVAASASAGAQDAGKPAPQRDSKAQETEAKEQQKSPADTIRDYSVERRTEAVAAATRATDELDRQLERLQTQMSEGWSRMSAATRQRSQETMADLRMRRSALAEWVGGMKHGSSAAWTEVKTGFGKSYDELESALRRARAELRRAPAEQPAPAPAKKPADTKGG
jgi:uncharacterized protein (DUF3084 family)